MRKILSIFRIFERRYTLDAISAIAVNSDTCIVFNRHALWRLILSTGETVPIEHTYGRLNVLNFSVSNGTVYFGDYKYNPDKTPMSVYKIAEGSFKTEKVHTFSKGEVNHIHTIVPDRRNGSIWILTGDFDESAAIWRTDESFKKVEKVIGNTQLARSCIAAPCDGGLLYVTDSPMEDNFLMRLYNDGGEYKIKKLAPVSGSCIYGGYDGKGQIVFSTTVENQTNETDNRKNMYRYNLGHGIKDWYSHVMSVDTDTCKIAELAKFKKDILPMLPFLYGCVRFPYNLNPDSDYVMYGQAVKKIDGKCIKISRR